MISTKESTNIFEKHRMIDAWYVTGHYTELKDTHMLPRLTIDEQIALGAIEDGPGETERNLGKYMNMSPRESRVALISLIEQELITYGPAKEWMF